MHLGTISGFWPTQVKYAVQAERYPMEWQRVHDSAQWLMEKDREVGLNYLSFVPTDPEVSKKSGEVNPFISAAIAKAISGQITLDQFDEEVRSSRMNSASSTTIRLGMCKRTGTICAPRTSGWSTGRPQPDSNVAT